MPTRLAPTHAVLVALIAAITAYLTWSSVAASTRLDNLVVVVPVAVLVALLAVVIVVRALLSDKDEPAGKDGGSALTDVLLLSVFAVFCVALTTIGFDVATFAFVWVGIVMSGERNLWRPPLFSAFFTVLLVEGFGSLFPYPMTTLVL